MTTTEHGAEISRRFAGVCCVYDDPTWLEPMIRSVYDNIGALVFLVGEKPWNGPASDNWKTLEIIRSTPDPARKISLIRGNWPTETEQRNAGLVLLHQRGFEYCFIVDADEIYDPLELFRMQQLAVSNPQIGAWYTTMWTYWKSEKYRIDPPEQFTPPVFLKIGRARFAEHRNVIAHGHETIPPEIGRCHHFSYARSDAEVARKLKSFSHSHEIRPGWYESVWKMWDEDPQMENLHPVYPAAYRRAIPQPPELLPPVLRSNAFVGVSAAPNSHAEGAADE